MIADFNNKALIALLVGFGLTLLGCAYEDWAIIGIIILLAVQFCIKGHSEIKIVSAAIVYFFFVYSTYLGKENWLGANFYQCFINSTIPLGWVLLIISVLYIFWILFLAKEFVSIKRGIGIFIITIVIDLIIWYPLSFISYYSGAEGRISQISDLVYKTTDTILHSDRNTEEKEQVINEVYSTVSIRAYLLKNQKMLSETNLSRSIIENPRATDVYYKKYPEIKIGNNIYQYVSSKVYRPGVVDGVGRAITWSVYPDRICGDDLMLEDMGIEASSNSVYYNRRKAGRSMNWWLIFSVTYALFVVAAYREQKSNAKVAKMETKLKTQYDNTGLYQELLFAQLMKEFNGVVASNAKSHLQDFVGKLERENDKQVYTEDGFDVTMDTVKDSIGDKIHTLKNNWNDAVNYSNSDDDDKRRLVNVILNDLRKLNTVFDISYKDKHISELEAIVAAGIPAQYSKVRSFNFQFQPLNKDLIEDNLIVSVNEQRLQSIIDNLLKNSNKATIEYKKKLSDETKKKYRRSCRLVTNIEKIDGSLFYTITVIDNGGGFSETEHLGKIYIEPVVSSDKTFGERKGAGSVYIGMFVRRMGGEITAENIIFDDNNKGAKTKISIPLKKVNE